MTSSSNNIKVLIIGFGLSAQIFHAPFILALPNCFTLHGFVTKSNQSLAKESFPQASIYNDVTSALESAQQFDLVIVTSPNTLHFAHAKQALLANKHVIVEKPFTITSVEAQELVDLAQEQKLILTVYQNRR